MIEQEDEGQIVDLSRKPQTKSSFQDDTPTFMFLPKKGSVVKSPNTNSHLLWRLYKATKIKLATCFFVNTEKTNDAAEHAEERIQIPEESDTALL